MKRPTLPPHLAPVVTALGILPAETRAALAQQVLKWAARERQRPPDREPLPWRPFSDDTLDAIALIAAVYNGSDFGAEAPIVPWPKASALDPDANAFACLVVHVDQISHTKAGLLLQQLPMILREICPPLEHPPTHSEDFRSVRWYGSVYDFSVGQAECVKVLWEHWERGGLGASQETIIGNSSSNSTGRLDIIFRNHPAWGPMIVGGSKKGVFRLALPTSQENSKCAQE